MFVGDNLSISIKICKKRIYIYFLPGIDILMMPLVVTIQFWRNGPTALHIGSSITNKYNNDIKYGKIIL